MTRCEERSRATTEPRARPHVRSNDRRCDRATASRDVNKAPRSKNCTIPRKTLSYRWSNQFDAHRAVCALFLTDRRATLHHPTTTRQSTRHNDHSSLTLQRKNDCDQEIRYNDRRRFSTATRTEYECRTFVTTRCITVCTTTLVARRRRYHEIHLSQKNFECLTLVVKRVNF